MGTSGGNRVRVRSMRGAAVMIVAGAALLALGGVGGLVGLASAQTSNSTTTTSTKTVRVTQRADLADAPPPECGSPGSDPVKVDESTSVEQVVTLGNTIGPAQILIGDLDAGGTPFKVEAGTTNLDVLTTTTYTLTQYFQATAAGEGCAVLASAARFTG